MGGYERKHGDSTSARFWNGLEVMYGYDMPRIGIYIRTYAIASQHLR